MYAKITEQFADQVPAGSCFVASQKDVSAELMAQCQCVARTCNCTCLGQITNGQQTRVAKYARLWCAKFGNEPSLDPSAAFHVNDDPDHRVIWSGGADRALPTFRHSMGPIYLPCENRTLHRSDYLFAMGWKISDTRRFLDVLDSLTDLPQSRYAR